jgi:large subunit ribosomal protein L17
LFGPIAERYRDRPGGYTRVLRIPPKKKDQAPSAILELVDGPKDMRFAMTAKTIARCMEEDKDLSDITLANIKKVTRFREGGQGALEKMVEKMKEVAKTEPKLEV